MGFQFTSPLFPDFNVGKAVFGVGELDDGEIGVSIVVGQKLPDGSYLTWGGYPNETGWLIDYPYLGDPGSRKIDQMIAQIGSLRNVLQWVLDEAVRRAKLKVAVPLPTGPDDRPGRLRYHLIQSATWNPALGAFNTLPAQLVP